MTEPDPTVRDAGEAGILARILPRLPIGRHTLLGPGDDAAVVAAPDRRVVVTTDVLVQDVHFRLPWSTGEDVGWRAAMQNLADVAAMGAAPTALVVALVVPAQLPVSWLEGLADGLGAACAQAGAAVVGGDLSGGDAVVISVTALGDLEGRSAVTRSGARPGDVLAVAGTLGRSALGWRLLATGGDGEASGRQPIAEESLAAYRRPLPPLRAGIEAARAGARAMLDISDGLVRDVGRIATSSGVQIDLHVSGLEPDVTAVSALARELGEDPWALVLTGGEDHGLAAVFPASAELPAGFRPIGSVREGAGVTLDGEPSAHRGLGWDHFGG